MKTGSSMSTLPAHHRLSAKELEMRSKGLVSSIQGSKIASLADDTLLMRLGIERDRARSLQPYLKSILEGLCGEGKTNVDVTGIRTLEPESAEKLIAELTAILDDVHQTVLQIYTRL